MKPQSLILETLKGFNRIKETKWNLFHIFQKTIFSKVPQLKEVLCGDGPSPRPPKTSIHFKSIIWYVEIEACAWGDVNGDIINNPHKFERSKLFCKPHCKS